jgi:phage-related minor tail protein
VVLLAARDATAWIELADERVAELSKLCGFADDLVGQITAIINRARGLYAQIHPTLERVLDLHLNHPAVLDVVQHYPSPVAMAAASEQRLGTRLSVLA